MLTFRPKGTEKTPYRDYCVARNFCWFYFSASFPAIRKNKLPQIKITATIFLAKIYSRVVILVLRFATLKYRSKKSCLFNYNLYNLKMVYNELLVLHKVRIPQYCTYITKTKILSMLGTWYFLKIAKISSQREKNSLS